MKHGSLRRIGKLRDRASFAVVRGIHGRGRIASGPFLGMKFGVRYPFGTPFAIGIGTYEMELWPVLAKLKGMSFRQFLDIGGADGYYAVGGALFLGLENVVVFEALELGRAAIRDHARINGVGDRISIWGTCHEDDLCGLLDPSKQDLVLMDVEGAETELLSDRVCARLGRSVVVIEAHDFVRPGITPFLVDKFRNTHHVDVVVSRPRTAADWPIAVRVPHRSKLALMDERRPCAMNWVVCFPR